MTESAFCPSCGTARAGQFRFCRSCGFDFDTGTAETAPPGAARHADAPVTAKPVPTAQSFTERYGPSQPVPPPKVESTTSTRGLRPLLIVGGLVLGGVAVALAASGALRDGGGQIGGAVVSTPYPYHTMTFAPLPTAGPTDEPTEKPILAPTDEPAPAAPDVVAVGTPVTVTCDDEPCLEVNVQKVKTATKYGSGYLADKPRSGKIYLAVYFTYKSLMGGATFNMFDWQLYVNDELVEDTAFVTEGPEPDLGSGQLALGRTAKGWIVWEVPKSGRVVLSYAPNYGEDPIYDVVLRSR